MFHTTFFTIFKNVHSLAAIFGYIFIEIKKEKNYNLHNVFTWTQKIKNNYGRHFVWLRRKKIRKKRGLKST